MRRISMFVLAIGIIAMMIPSADAFNATCADTFKKTAAGSTKDARCTIHCGNIGALPAEPGGIKFYANQTASGAELEACSDTGPGNQHGRLVTQIDSSNGMRIVLDSDEQQSDLTSKKHTLKPPDIETRLRFITRVQDLLYEAT